MSDPKPSFIAILCDNDTFASALPWAITISIILPTLILSILYYNVNLLNNSTKQQELILETKKAEDEKIKSFSFNEKILYFNKDKSVLEINFLLEKLNESPNTNR